MTDMSGKLANFQDMFNDMYHPGASPAQISKFLYIPCDQKHPRKF